MTKNGEVDFNQFLNDSRLEDSGDSGMGLPEFNDFRGATGGDQGGPLFNDYRQSAPDTGDVMSVQFDRSIGAAGRSQPRQRKAVSQRKGKS